MALAASSGDMPTPVSRILMINRPVLSVCAPTMTDPPSGVNLTALDRILIRICWIRDSSPSIAGSASDNWARSVIPNSTDCGSMRFRLDCRQRCTLTTASPHLGLASFKPGDVEDIVDDAEQLATGGVDILAIAADLLAVLEHRAFVDQVRESDDRIQRRAQFMAHLGQELTFRLVGLFGAHQRLPGGIRRPLGILLGGQQCRLGMASADNGAQPISILMNEIGTLVSMISAHAHGRPKGVIGNDGESQATGNSPMVR